MSDNKRINDLEKIIENDEINLANVQDKLSTVIEKKKSRIKKEMKENLERDKNNKNENVINNQSNEIVIGPLEKKTKLVVEFLFNPEYISVGQKIIINDQSLKAYGVITKIFK